MSQYFTQAFNFKAALNTSCRKCMTQNVKVDISEIAFLKHGLKIILHISRFNKAVTLSGQNISIRISLHFTDNIENKLRNRNCPNRTLAFRRSDNNFCFIQMLFRKIVLYPEHSFVDFQHSFAQIYIWPSQCTQFSYTNSCVYTKQYSEIFIIQIVNKIITEYFLLKNRKRLYIISFVFNRYSAQVTIMFKTFTWSILEDIFNNCQDVVNRFTC